MTFEQMVQYAPVTLAIIAATAYTSWLYFRLSPARQQDFLYFPYHVARGENLETIFSSMLIHANIAHFAFNMLTLFFLGPYVEYLIGSSYFFLIYLLSGLAAAAAQIYKFKDHPHYCSLGASGCTSGVVYSFIILDPTAPLQLLFIPFSFPAYAFGLVYLAFSYYQSKRQANDMIAHEAHIGGALAGALFTILLVPIPWL